MTTTLSLDTKIEDDLSADDAEVNSADMWTILRSIPKPINLRTFEYSDVDHNAPLGFKDLLKQILVFAQGVSTIPVQLKVSRV